MILPVLTYPNPVLRTKSAYVDPALIPDIDRLLDDLIDTMYAEDGIGLSAIQVGRPLRIFVLAGEIAQKPGPIVFINPELTGFSKEKVSELEGCLSFPGIGVRVERSQSLVCKALDRSFNPFELQAEGLLARAIGHETDHLDAKLLIDFAGTVQRELIKKNVQKNKARPGR